MDNQDSPIILTSANISMKLVIDDGDQFKNVSIPCSGCFLRFILNGIPEAVFKIPVGLPLISGVDDVEDTRSLTKLKSRARVMAYLHISGDYSKVDRKVSWDDSAHHLVFDGYMTDLQMTSAYGSCNFKLAATHWLSDLDSTSTFYKWLHPSSPTDLKVRAGLKLPGTRTSSAYLGHSLVSSYKDGEDLWQSVIKRLCMDLCTKAPPFTAFNNLISGDEGVTAQKAALLALQRMDAGDYMNVGSLVVDLPSRMRRGVTDQIANILLQTNGGSTLWQGLMSCASNLLFSIIPGVQTAVCAPVVPFNRDSWTTIYADEYNSFITSTSAYRSLRGIIGVGNTPAVTGSRYAPLHTAIYDLVDEGVLPEDDSGTFILTGLPAWCDSALNSRVNTENRDDIDGEKKTSTNTAGDTNAEYAVVKKVLKTLLLGHMYQKHTGVVSGKLRFDIAPGSTVGVEANSIANVEDEYEGMYGTVNVVEITIGTGESDTCKTVLHLNNLQTMDDKVSKALTLESHPLYNSSWAGSHLVRLEKDEE